MAAEVFDFPWGKGQDFDWTVISIQRERVIDAANEISEWFAADTTLGEWCFVRGVQRGEFTSFAFSHTITAVAFKLRFG